MRSIAAQSARPRPPPTARTVDSVRGGPVVYCASAGGEERLYSDERDRPLRGRDLCTGGWLTAGDRVSGGAGQAVQSGGVAGTAGAAPALPDRRRTRPARPPTDVAKHNRLELRPADSR